MLKTKFITPQTLADETGVCGVCGVTVRRALRLCAARLNFRRDARTWWKLDPTRADDLALLESARAFLDGSARHGLSIRRRGEIGGSCARKQSAFKREVTENDC